MGKVLGITDYFVIATVNSTTQADACIDAVEEAAESEGLPIVGVSGTKDSSWILIDCGDVVVHIFTPEAREYYRLESLWKDCPSFVFEESQ